MDLTKEWIDRFNAKWRLNKVNGCWEWTGATADKGYGQIKRPGTRRQIPAHRLSYLIHRGEIPDGKCVLHRCDNPCCVNPEHLFVGTKLDNAQDMVSKMRHTYGERQGGAKLTEADVNKTLELIAQGVKQVRIAQMLNVSPMQISRIKRGERWGHMQPDRPKWRKQRKFLSAEQAAEIVRRVALGEPQRVIAESFGISQAHVSRVALGKVAKFRNETGAAPE